MDKKDMGLQSIIIKTVIAIVVVIYTGFFDPFGNDIYEILSPLTKFYINANVEPYTQGKIGKKTISIFAGKKEIDPEYCPLINLSITNENRSTADVKQIKIEVCDYKDIDEFIVESPAGGAEERDIKEWECSISNQINTTYNAIYIGNEKVAANNKYICIPAGDSGEFELLVYPDRSGLYEIRVIVEYTFKSKIRSIRSSKMEFVFDPNGEINIAKDVLERYLFGLKKLIGII